MRPPKIDVQVLAERPQPVIMVKGITDPQEALRRAQETAEDNDLELIAPTQPEDVNISPTRAMPCRSLHGRIHNPPCRSTHYTPGSPGRGSFPGSFFTVRPKA